MAGTTPTEFDLTKTARSGVLKADFYILLIGGIWFLALAAGTLAYGFSRPPP
jgi:hypothetical protein